MQNLCLPSGIVTFEKQKDGGIWKTLELRMRKTSANLPTGTHVNQPNVLFF